jgi:peptide/nickel transport system substrate-binding protein
MRRIFAMVAVAAPTQPVYHAAEVHNAVFVPNIFQFDPTNLWITNG